MITKIHMAVIEVSAPVHIPYYFSMLVEIAR